MYLYAFCLYCFYYFIIIFFGILANLFSPVIVGGFSVLILLIFNITISINFKKIYFKFINNNIHQIESNNKTNFDEIIHLCEKKVEQINL